jgi:hypothetical protein
MKLQTALGILLVVVGALALAYQGFTYTTQEKVVDIGPVEVTREDRERVPLPPIIGGAGIALGVLLIVTGSRRP